MIIKSNLYQSTIVSFSQSIWNNLLNALRKVSQYVEKKLSKH